MTEPATAPTTLILGKFKTNEDLAAAYVELQKKLGAREAPSLPGSEPTAKPDAVESRPAGNSASAKANELVQNAVQALLSSSPDALGMLVGMGVPETSARMVTGLAAAAQEKYVNTIYESAGGKDAYKQILDWARESPTVTDFERESFMSEISSGNPSRVIIATKTLRERHLAETGYEPRDLVIGVPGGEARRVVPFTSQDEMGRAFADPRYTKDAAYTAEVQARAKVSK